MEKNIFTTDLGSLIGDSPIEVDGVDDGASLIPGAFEQRTEKEEPDKELEDDKDLIDLEEDSEQEDTEEEETEEDKEEEPSSDSKEKQSSSPLTPYAKLLKEEGILPNMDLESFDGTADGLKQAMVEEIIGAVEYYKDSLPDRVKNLINNYEEGVPLDKLLEIDRIEVEVEKISEDTIKEDVDLQKKMVETYLKKTSKFSEKKIKNMIQYYEDSGELESEALSATSELKDLITKEKEESIEEAKAAQQRAQQQAQKELAELNKKIQDMDEIIPGMKVNSKVKSDLVKSLTTPVGKDMNGNPVNRIVAARMENPIDFEIKLHYLFEITKGFKDFSKLVEKGKKDSIKEFEDAATRLDRSTDGTVQDRPDKKHTDKFINSITKTFNIK
jgi:predicted GIY-YIG superfamily endonuclease